MVDDATGTPGAAVALVRTLEESRALGFLGSRPIEEVVVHARHFVDAITASGVLPTNPDDPPGTVLDLGAGGGVPGLVIACELPSAHVTLLDRRRTRTDFLERVVRRLEWADRVRVVNQDASRPSAGQRGTFDAVVARGFGPPLRTLQIAVQWVRPGGVIAISEPPMGDRWAALEISRFGVARRVSGPSVAVFVRE